MSDNSSSTKPPKGDKSSHSNTDSSDFNGLLPFAITGAALSTKHEVPVESVVSKSRAKELWNRMFSVWGVNDPGVKQELVVCVMLYFIKNGSSPRGGYTGEFTTAGGTFKVSIIKYVLHDDVRKFARANADLARAVLVSNQDLMDELQEKYSFPNNCAELCFDFSEFCTHLTESQKRTLLVARKARVQSSEAYDVNERVDTFSRGVTSEVPSSNGGSPAGQFGSGGLN